MSSKKENDFFDNLNVGDAIIESLQQAVAYKNGNPSHVRVTVRSIPQPEYKQVDIVRLRKNLELTQKGMAAVLGVSPRTLEGWEIGRSTPNPTARRLLYLIDKHHGVVNELATIIRE